MNILSRLCTPIREFGPMPGALYILDRILGRISRRLGVRVYEFMVQPIADGSLMPERFARGITIRALPYGSADMERMPIRSDVLQSRMAQNATCLGAYRGNGMIGYIWLCASEYQEDEVRCTYVLEPATQSVFDFDLYIFPEHRMGLAFGGIWNGVNAYLRERDIRFTFSRLTRFNLASRRAHAHLGWKRIARAVFLIAWNLEIMFATIRPFVGVGLNPRKRVKIRLTADILKAA